MINRQLEEWLGKQVDDPHVIQIQGLRQTGKTTLMESFRKNLAESLHYPLQNLVVLQRYQNEPERLSLELEQALTRRDEKNQGPLHIFIDEIQKIPLFYQAIQGLYDAHKKRLKFWIWGSSARPTKRKRAETLAGRVFTKILWPLSHSEIFQKKSIIPHLTQPETFQKYSRIEPLDYKQKLNRCLVQSLLPEPFLEESGERATSILESYQATYLENEIRRENLVRDIVPFQRFLILAASEDGLIVNHAAKAKVLGLSPVTIQNYYNILEDTFVSYTLPAYSKSLRVQISKSPKIYFADSGFARFIAGSRGYLHRGTSEFGGAFESLVITEFKKQMEYHGLPWQLSYFRTKTDIEVDLVVKTPEKKFACEIKSTGKVDRGDYQNILKLMKLDPEIAFGIVLSLDPRVEEIAPKIYNIPSWNL